MEYTQSNSPIAVTTPLGKDVLLLEGFRGLEAISQLYHYELDLLTPVPLVDRVAFDKERAPTILSAIALSSGHACWLLSATSGVVSSRRCRCRRS